MINKLCLMQFFSKSARRNFISGCAFFVALIIFGLNCIEICSMQLEHESSDLPSYCDHEEVESDMIDDYKYKILYNYYFIKKQQEVIKEM